MEWLKLVPLAILLPLFPASMLFNLLRHQVGKAWGRLALMLVWSQAGVGLLVWLQPEIPSWLPWWALATAFFHAFRALVLNEVSDWTGFMFVSLLSLFWLLPAGSLAPSAAQLHALLAVAPLLVLEFLSGSMAARFGSAYLGLVGGLVQGFPRLSGLIALGVLAAMATPPFPLFFQLVDLVRLLPPLMATGLLLVWYFWGWAGVRLLQRLVLGPAARPQFGATEAAADLPAGVMWGLASIFAGMAALGLGEAMRMAGAG